ncbi:MAG: hypothetical protein KY468_04755 [Armatimonadetes bacterium]|nr:hypothetical protein [Armatimonadota bacterium]
MKRTDFFRRAVLSTALFLAFGLLFGARAHASLAEWLNGTAQTPAAPSSPLPVVEYLSGTQEGTALASAARTASTASSDLANASARGVLLFLDVTAAGATGGLTLRAQYKDPVSGRYVDINAAPAAVTTASTTAYVIYPGSTAGGTQATSAPLSKTWRINVAHGDASSYTYSVSYSYIK